MKGYEVLDEVLGITDVVEKSTEVVSKTPKKDNVPSKINNEDVDNDYKYQRENYYTLIERGQDAIEGILDIAKNQNIQEHMKLLVI